jgi:hypothetical protein
LPSGNEKPIVGFKRLKCKCFCVSSGRDEK